MRVVFWIIVVVALVVVISKFMQYRRKQAAKDQPAESPQDPYLADTSVTGDPRSIRLGDIVEHLIYNYAVRGTVTYKEGGYTWKEHFLDDASGKRRWISVEEDPDVVVVMWSDIPGSQLSPEATVTHAGVQYMRHEDGTAVFTSIGTTGLPASGQAEYIDYRAPNGRRLSFERFGTDKWEVAEGEVVPSGMLTIYPANRSSTK